MMGLLDPTDDPRTMGLLSLGMGLLGSKGSFGNALSQAGPQALQAMRQVQQDKARKEQMAQAQQMQQLQMQQAQMAMAQQQAQQKLMGGRREALKGAWSNGSPGMSSPNGDYSGDFTAPAKPAGPDMNAYLQALVKRGDFEGAMPVYQSMQKDTTPIKLGKDDRLLDPTTRKVLVDALPDQAKQPSAVQEYQFAQGQGYKGTFQEFQTALKKAGATNVRVDAGQRFENAYSTNQGREFSDTMAGINKTAFAAPAQIRKLERMEQLLAGVDGGKLAPTGLDIASAANSIGIKIDPKLGNKEAAQALAREIAGGFRQPGTGPMTDKDFENFLLQVPDLSKTTEGRKQITSTMKAAAARDIAVAKLAREYERANGKLDNGFLDIAAQYIAENPVVGMPSGWKVR